MGQSPSSIKSKSGRRRSFRFSRKSKHNKSILSHTFNLAPSDEYPELMNINVATEEQLMTLPGVNRQLAQAIVRHRQLIGRFKRVDDLALVSGIGAEKLELLRPEICVNFRRALSRASSYAQSLESIRTTVESRLCCVNSASIFQLQCIPGLNQELAAKIVDYRIKKGPFKSLDDLIKVRGMDIMRLGAIKPHLSLESQKSESVQQLSVNDLSATIQSLKNHSLSNGSVKNIKKNPCRKTLSMPTNIPLTLPNGFAAAPVNDILDLLAAYSHRPSLAEHFNYERDGVKCCRIASWNLYQLSIDKILNPGVREVVCRTILENKFSIIAIQDVMEENAVKIICDELNCPMLRRVKEWKHNNQKWDYCISKKTDSPKLCFIFDGGVRGIQIEDIAIDQVCLLTEGEEVRQMVDGLLALKGDGLIVSSQAFLINSRPFVLVNVACQKTLDEETLNRLRDVLDTASRGPVPVAVVGELASWDNVEALQVCEPLLNEELTTTVDLQGTGRSAILCPGTIDKSRFNGRAGVIKSGLSHLAIPRGWSWGGPASPFCPIWAELNVPD